MDITTLSKKRTLSVPGLALVLLAPLAARPASAQGVLTLEEAVSHALGANPELASEQAQVNAEKDAIRAESWLADPKLGLGRQAGMSFMEQDVGPMNTWSISQDFRFPTKYFLLASAQRARTKGAMEDLLARKLEIRRKVIASYYALFANERTLTLLEAQKQTLRQIARLAEARHATGGVPQADEMKAHLEETRIEDEILLADERREEIEAGLNALLDQEASGRIELPQADPPVPKLEVEPSEIQGLAHRSARHILHRRFLLEEARARQSLARSDYLPDFSLSFEQAYGPTSFAGNYAFGIELSVPLWFFARQSSETAAADQKLIAAEKSLDGMMRDTHAEVRALTSRVQDHAKLLRIYQSALIPQASTTLSSSRSSYQSGRTTFTDLLDSERSLYSIEVAYYQALAQYVENLASLEEKVGTSLSSLPFPALGEKP